MIKYRYNPELQTFWNKEDGDYTLNGFFGIKEGNKDPYFLRYVRDFFNNPVNEADLKNSNFYGIFQRWDKEGAYVVDSLVHLFYLLDIHFENYIKYEDIKNLMTTDAVKGLEIIEEK